MNLADGQFAQRNLRPSFHIATTLGAIRTAANYNLARVFSSLAPLLNCLAPVKICQMGRNRFNGREAV
jgi:hypothetical protein